MPYVRIAELEIEPARLADYAAAVREEIEESVRVEPGVLAIHAVAEQDAPARLGSSRSMPTRRPMRRTSPRRISSDTPRRPRG